MVTFTLPSVFSSTYSAQGFQTLFGTSASLANQLFTTNSITSPSDAFTFDPPASEELSFEPPHVKQELKLN